MFSEGNVEILEVSFPVSNLKYTVWTDDFRDDVIFLIKDMV